MCAVCVLCVCCVCAVCVLYVLCVLRTHLWMYVCMHACVCVQLYRSGCKVPVVKDPGWNDGLVSLVAGRAIVQT